MIGSRRTLTSVAVALLCAFAAPRAVLAEPPVTAALVAGSGRIGHDDGPAASASFTMPSGLTYLKDGTLLVADEGAQRIRAISPDGVVTTLAGSGETNGSGQWVDGGYADGPASSARFDRPDALAVGSDGVIYVADRNNGCIRAISRGQVTTFARGLKSPRGIALDRDGTMYVADWEMGIVRVGRDGTLTPVVTTGGTADRPTAIGFGRSGPSIELLFVGDAQGLLEIALPSLAARRTPAFQSGSEGGEPAVPGDFPFGVPHAVAAFDATDVVYTDLRDSSVKYFRLHAYARFLGQTPPEDAPLQGGGGDSPDGVPRFDVPLGIAIDSKERVVVADAGNRRIVRLSAFDRRTYITADQFEKFQFEPKHYRIALVGSSFSWYFSAAPDSIAERLAAMLSDVPALQTRPPAGKYFQIGRLTGEFDLIQNVLSLGTADLVVLLISPIDPRGLGLGSQAENWTPTVRAGLQRSVAAMKAARIPFVVAVLPAPQDVSPVASPYLFDQKEADEGTDYESERASLLAALAGIDVPTLDLFGAFRDEFASVPHPALYIAGDVHLTLAGRELVASELAHFVKRLAPWRAQP